MTAVMKGVRILEVAEHTFVPAASAVLADWGAEVIKIEHVERGDAMRGLASTGVLSFGDSKVHPLLEHSNRGKQSLGLDLSKPEGAEILYKLATTADVFLTNKMPTVRTKLRIDVDDIRAHNPRIIYVRGSGYGVRGPDADAGGYDSLGFWARAGNAKCATPADLDGLIGQPAPAYGDSIGAMTIAGGISAALFHRAQTGEATIVDVSLLSTGLWAIGAAVALSVQLGVPWAHPPMSGGATRNALTGNYRTGDGKWLTLTCLQGFHYWPDARRVLGLERLADDPRFADPVAFAENSPTLAAIIAERLASEPLATWKERFRGFRGQWAPVQDTLEVLDDPQVVHNGYVQDTITASGDPCTLVATPVQFDEEAMPPKRAPEFNEHGDAILEGLGLDWDTIVDLKVKGIVA